MRITAGPPQQNDRDQASQPQQRSRYPNGTIGSSNIDESRTMPAPANTTLYLRPIFELTQLVGPSHNHFT
eukprot:scaffold4049_cov63-Cyclotella_meneghiniana.AAC.3